MMRPFRTIILGLSAVALLAVVALPHHHDKSSFSHQTSSCRACKIQEGFSATPSPVVDARPSLVWVAISALHVASVPLASVVLPAAPPRAPPLVS